MRLPLFLILASSSFLHAQSDPFKDLDKNGDGNLAIEEIPENLRPVFPLADQNGDKLVSPEEFRQFAEKSRPAQATGEIEQLKDVDYVGNGNPRQNLDILIHKDHETKKRPLVVFIHGGGWMEGSKENGLDTIRAVASTGDYVAATINYRLSQEATWPAQIHDCKAAIRFLRGNADKYGIDAEHIGVMGLSAGGQLVGVLGTCYDVSMEGKLGSYPTISSKVQCVVNFFGPTDFLKIYGPDVPIEKIRKEKTALRVLGNTDEEIRLNARTASPVTWITKDSAPFLTAHGTKDDLVPFPQAVELDTKLREAGVESHLIAMEGAGHGFFSPDLNERIRRFLNLHLKGEAGEISNDAIQIR